jgi:hypothetical protein
VAGLFSFPLWDTPIIGASGAVLALLTVYAMNFPNRRVLMFFIFPMPVWLAVVIIGFISIAFSMTSTGGIAHITHLGGILAALGYIKAWPLFLRLVWRFKKNRYAGRTGPVAEPAESNEYDVEAVDTILKKISMSGLGSLTVGERDILKKASARLAGKGKKGRIIPFDIS